MSAFNRKIKAISSSIKNLFDRLNAIRVNHDNRPDVSISPEFDIPSSLKPKSLAKTEVISSLHEDITVLVNKIPNVNTSVTTPYAKITVPSIKDLLKASDFENIEATINALEGLCPDCSNCSGHNSGHNPGGGGCNADHGNFSHHTDKGHNNRCDDYGNYTGNHPAAGNSSNLAAHQSDKGAYHASKSKCSNRENKESMRKK